MPLYLHRLFSCLEYHSLPFCGLFLNPLKLRSRIISTEMSSLNQRDVVSLCSTIPLRIPFHSLWFTVIVYYYSILPLTISYSSLNSQSQVYESSTEQKFKRKHLVHNTTCKMLPFSFLPCEPIYYFVHFLYDFKMCWPEREDILVSPAAMFFSVF